MELKQNLIHRKYDKARARNQITIGDDYSLAEGKPDLARILQTKPEMIVDEVHTEKGKIKIQGKLKVWVLYLADRSEELASCLETEFPFDEILYMEGAANGDHLKIGWNIEELQVEIIHPGKLGVRALVTLYGEIAADETIMITEGITGAEGICTKGGEMTFAEPVLEQKASYRIRDEVVLPANKPNVQTILWKELQLRGLDLRIQEGRIAIKGEILFWVIYQPESESGKIQWMEQSIPFHGTVDVEGITPEMFGVPEAEVSCQNIELKPDYDGEMRLFQIEMQIELQLQAYEERICKCLVDAYSTKELITLQTQEVLFHKLRMCNQTKCRVEAQRAVTEEASIVQILGNQSRILNKRTKRTEQGILWEGTLEVQVVYLTANEEHPLGSMTVMVPCSQLIEIPEIGEEDLWKVSELPEQLFINVIDGLKLEVRGVIGLNACVLEQCRLQNVMEIKTESYDPQEQKKRPGMMIHFVQPNETLWEIAKKHRSTMEDLQRENELTTEEIVAGQKLIIMKHSEETIFS